MLHQWRQRAIDTSASLTLRRHFLTVTLAPGGGGKLYLLGAVVLGNDERLGQNVY